MLACRIISRQLWWRMVIQTSLHSVRQRMSSPRRIRPRSTRRRTMMKKRYCHECYPSAFSMRNRIKSLLHLHWFARATTLATENHLRIILPATKESQLWEIDIVPPRAELWISWSRINCKFLWLFLHSIENPIKIQANLAATIIIWHTKTIIATLPTVCHIIFSRLSFII